MDKDYYKILEINRNASEDDIKKSYRKLALKYHPDRCKEPGSEEKFKEISEAYSILSVPDKKKQYDVMGSTDDFNFDEEDSFSIFNNIFKQHLNSFMNMQYENEINIDNIFNNLSGGKFSNPFSFGNVHIKVHTFQSSDSNIDSNIENFINPFDLINNLNEKEDNTAFIKEKKQKLKKPDNININITVSFEDIYNEKNINIPIKRNRKRSDGSYKIKTKKFNIPIYGREIIIKGEGNEYDEYKESGDIFIEINNKLEENFKRMNDYDILTFYPITFEKISKDFIFKLSLPNKKVINVLYQKNSLKNQKHMFQKIDGLGIPYYDNSNLKNGDLYILYYLSFDNSENINENIDKEEYISKNCIIDNIFQNNL